MKKGVLDGLAGLALGGAAAGNSASSASGDSGDRADAGNPGAGGSGGDSPSADDDDGDGEGDAEQRRLFQSPDDAFGAAAGAQAGGAQGATGKRKRGRPPGSGRKAGQAKKTNSASLEGIEGMLLSIHLMGAAMLSVPELALTESEAKKMSQAIARVAELYDFGMSEKMLAWSNLMLCFGGIYGTRAFAYSNRMKAEARRKPKVVDINSQNAAS